MAEQQNGTGGMQRAAEGALLQLAARYGVVAMCLIALPVAGFIGKRVVDGLDEVVRSVSRLETDVAVMKNDIGYLKERVKP